MRLVGAERMTMQRFDVQPHAHLRPSLWDHRLMLGRLVITFSMDRSVHTKPDMLANRVASLRRERGMARRELASLFQIHPSTLAALEEGNYAPSLRLALRLSEFFNVPVETLFSL